MINSNRENDNGPYVLYIGNLDRQVTEQSIGDLFGKFGPIKRCKLITEHGGNDPYGFVEYAEKSSAACALESMNGFNIGSRTIKVNWATNSNMRKDTNHYHIFVGDLSPDIDTVSLRNAFNQFGHVSDARVVKDLATGKPRGYGFVSYQFKHEAENAMQSMNGVWLAGRAIRTNWATRKPGPTTNRQNSDSSSTKSLNFDEIYLQTGVYNCTVYVGNLSAGTTEETLRRIFIPFGPIADIRVFPDKNYAFIRYMSHDHATNAIVMIHGTAIEGSHVKCSWGKEANDPILAQQAQQQLQFQQYYYQQQPQQVYQQQPQPFMQPIPAPPYQVYTQYQQFGNPVMIPMVQQTAYTNQVTPSTQQQPQMIPTQQTLGVVAPAAARGGPILPAPQPATATSYPAMQQSYQVQ